MFPVMAKDHLKELRNVLRNSADEDQRATAVYVIAYAPKKAEVIDDLQYALKDADAGVRHNAVQALLAFAVLARLHPELELKVEPTWFIEMLNSLSWSDRNRALHALQVLTDKDDPAVLEQLRTRAMASLIEMARWKTLEHALPAYILVGRIAGLSDASIQAAWSRGDRESVIAAAAKKKK
jgi:HEAT repeat protein